MPKKNEESTDSAALWTIGAFLFGSVLAKPSQESINQLNIYKSQEQLFNQYKLNYNDFVQYLNNRYSFQEYKREKQLDDARLNSLGNIRINPAIANYPNIRKFLDEAIQLFLKGYFRNSCISCAIVMESLLKLKYSQKRFVDLISEAHNQGLISKSDKLHLDAIRLDRNDFVHTLDSNPNETDAKIVILITIRILDKAF